MISSVRGTVRHLDSDTVVVEVGGVGLSVSVPVAVSRHAHLGEELQLHTSLIVREDALSLYGFESREELAVFTQLIGVTGVGPKSALGVLSSLSVHQIAEAVTSDDDAPFRRVSGIGPKTAKLIVVQLAGRLTVPIAGAATAASVPPGVPLQVKQALIGLGWSERTAVEAVAITVEEATEAEKASVQALLRRTLTALGPARKETTGG
ncbi:Holliday junction branch migration protein RuvA [Microbacterium sp. P07]|uniref:Holliday junction branch migration protein RuvA n=1 Tax=Microbacterium sp. P07 TaxID=3366952 RepID=UPI003746E26A